MCSTTDGTTNKGIKPGHYWYMTHPGGKDPEFPMSEWAQRWAEQNQEQPQMHPGE